jgi:hypothetical protein
MDYITIAKQYFYTFRGIPAELAKILIEKSYSFEFSHYVAKYFRSLNRYQDSVSKEIYQETLDNITTHFSELLRTGKVTTTPQLKKAISEFGDAQSIFAEYQTSKIAPSGMYLVNHIAKFLINVWHLFLYVVSFFFLLYGIGSLFARIFGGYNFSAPSDFSYLSVIGFRTFTEFGGFIAGSIMGFLLLSLLHKKTPLVKVAYLTLISGALLAVPVAVYLTQSVVSEAIDTNTETESIITTLKKGESTTFVIGGGGKIMINEDSVTSQSFGNQSFITEISTAIRQYPSWIDSNRLPHMIQVKEQQHARLLFLDVMYDSAENAGTGGYLDINRTLTFFLPQDAYKITIEAKQSVPIYSHLSKELFAFRQGENYSRDESFTIRTNLPTSRVALHETMAVFQNCAEIDLETGMSKCVNDGYSGTGYSVITLTRIN